MFIQNTIQYSLDNEGIELEENLENGATSKNADEKINEPTKEERNLSTGW